MRKLVTLKIGTGTVEGHAVTLQIAEEHAASERHQSLLQLQAEIPGKLPAATELLQAYAHWQSTYRTLDIRYRLEADPGQTKNVSYVSLLEDCQNAAKQFYQRFDRWLKVDSLRLIRETLLSRVPPSEEVRFVIQVDDPRLQRLPWHLGDIFERYQGTEVVLASPEFERIQPVRGAKPKVKILAILGNSKGIDTQRDREILEQLPNAKVEFLPEPDRQELSDQLWQQQWDILFFAGHSSSRDDDAGQIYINQTDSLTISALRFALKQAIANGLQIAIFNSCDGLGLARSLADLKIPQVVVMREPVPDRVAQAFLKGFLTQFSQGDSFYKSMREAREKLQPLEQEFPCATWLPVVYQNPTALPPTWSQLRGEPEQNRRRLRGAALASLLTTGMILASRALGLLQPLELNVLDQTLRLRPPEDRDARLLVVEVTERDLALQADKPQQASSLSNAYLDALLKKLLSAEPVAIGLDIYRDNKSSQGFKTLNQELVNQQLITVCKVKDVAKGIAEIPPAPEVRDNVALGFSDISIDEGNANVVRRHLLSMGETPSPGGRCNPLYGLALALAYQYPYPDSVQLKTDNEDTWKWGAATLQRLNKHTGGYQQFDDRGFQILLNYRSTQDGLRDAIPSITLEAALRMKPEELKQQIENRIVLIGTTAESYKDIVATPYAAIPTSSCNDYQCIPGVFLQAQMTSQLISAVLGERPLLWALPMWADGLIVLGAGLLGMGIAWLAGRVWILVVLVGGSIMLLSYASVLLLVQPGVWLPLVPAVLALGISATCVKIYLIRGAPWSGWPLGKFK